jgi:hypothetical protein
LCKTGTALRFIAAEFPDAPLDEHLIDTYAVTTLFFSTGGTFWTNNTRWKSGEPVCMWHGIECDGRGYIIAIDTPRNNMGGFLPPEIGLLSPRQVDQIDKKDDEDESQDSEDNADARTTGLQRINVSQNSIGGSIPPQVGFLTSLQVFLVNGNTFTGMIPNEISAWTEIQEVSFDGNSQLSGIIPDSVCYNSNNRTINNTDSVVYPSISVDCGSVYCGCCCGA